MREGITSLSAISPLDGRYRSKLVDVADYFSEYALIRDRCITELTYFQKFVTQVLHKKLNSQVIEKIIESFDSGEAEKIKEIEKRTNHDVKAVEYYLQEKLHPLHVEYLEYIHFGLTSEDINSVAYGLALSRARSNLIEPELKTIISTLGHMAHEYKDVVMLARTHGQPAIPTTMGKELIVFAMRLAKEFENFRSIPIEAKLTGAVGNYNALHTAFPDVDWIKFGDTFVSSFGLKSNHHTTQIVSSDSYVKLFQSLELVNNILIGLSQDVWRYISDEYFILSTKKDEVGSSTMPHKVNPIDFENAEGNLGLANSMFSYFSSKLPISRLQRDLSDSTVKRNFGSAIAFGLLGYKSLTEGLQKLKVNENKCTRELENHWEVITEGIQTILRTSGDRQAFEKLKDFTRGKKTSQTRLRSFIESANFSPQTKKQISQLSPHSYTGLAPRLVQKGVDSLKKAGLL